MNKALCWFDKETSYPLIVLPTGAGKTVVFVSMIRDLYLQDPSKRFLILAHRQEPHHSSERQTIICLAQSHQWAYSLPVSRSLTAQRPLSSQVGIPLASKTRLEKSLPFDYIIIDEAHHVGTEKRSRYRKIIDHFEEIGCPKIMGVTATPYRMGQGYIYGMGDHVFGGVAADRKPQSLSLSRTATCAGYLRTRWRTMPSLMHLRQDSKFKNA